MKLFFCALALSLCFSCGRPYKKSIEHLFKGNYATYTATKLKASKPLYSISYNKDPEYEGGKSYLVVRRRFRKLFFIWYGAKYYVVLMTPFETDQYRNSMTVGKRWQPCTGMLCIGGYMINTKVVGQSTHNEIRYRR